MSLPLYSINGAREFELRAPKINKVSDGPDRATCYWQSEARDRFKIGEAPPRFPHLRIVEVEPTEEVEGEAYENVLQCEGFVDDKLFVETEFSLSQPEEGWDELRRGVFTREPDHKWFARGSQLIDPYTGLVPKGFEWMWIVDRDQRRHRARDYYEVGMVLKGLRGDKPVKRRINTTPQTVAPGVFDGAFFFTAETYSGFPPQRTGDTGLTSGGEINVEYDIPQVSVTDTFVTSTPPPTDFFPGFWSPDNPPPIFIFPVFATSYTWHIPWGWKALNIQSEQLAGQQLWIVSITWGYQVATTPRT